MNPNRQVFLFSGPSGVGKDTVLELVRQRYPDLKFSISTTTRQRRSPADDAKYTFISNEAFEQGIKEGAFLEYAQYCESYYGTPAAPIETWNGEGFDVIVECEVQGALKIMEVMPQVISIFILPPSIKELRRRLEKRQTDAPEKIEKRVATAIEEIKQAVHYKYIVTNDVLEDTVDRICGIIATYQSSVERNKNKIHEVLENA